MSHFYYDVSVRSRLSCEEISDERRIKKLKNKWRTSSVGEEQITTQHELEAAGGAAFKREVFQKVGLFDESLLRGEDTDMSRRLRGEGILVYYYPYHQIRHQYGRSLFDTAKKHFATGYNRWRYYKKYSHEPAGIVRLVPWVIEKKTGALLSAFWRARQAKSLGEFFLYLPFMCLFETANKLGFFCSMLQSTLNKTTPKRE